MYGSHRPGASADVGDWAHLPGTDYVCIRADGIHLRREHAEQAVKTLAKLYGAKFPKAVAKAVRLRTKVTKGACSRAAGLAMVFKLVDSAQARWRAVNGSHLVPLVRAGARFGRGLLVERSEMIAA